VKETTRTDENSSPPPSKKHDIYIRIFNAEERMHTDQTGHFPANSSSGDKYIMLLVEINGNCIDGEPMNERPNGRINDQNLPDPVGKNCSIKISAAKNTCVR
jgi:hypothetical protein